MEETETEDLAGGPDAPQEGEYNSTPQGDQIQGEPENKIGPG